jgi:hypothetical protein
MCLLVGDRVKEDGAQMGGQALRVSDPLRVGRPGGVEAAAWIGGDVVFDLGRLPAGDLDRPQVQVIIVEQNVLSVG